MKKLYEKSEIWFAVTWIIVYCVLSSIADNISRSIGLQKCVTAPVLAILSIVLFVFLKKNGLSEKHGFCKSEIPASKMLFYIPVLIFLTDNLWYGVALNMSIPESVFYAMSMLFVGFLEEVIFRGLLFRAMEKDGLISAIVVSSVTFGMGHIVNLLNGSGAELLPNLLQVVYAIAVGFMFVMIYYTTKSLIVCIAAHSLFDVLSTFANMAVITPQKRIISCIFLVVVCGSYAIYIALRFHKKKA